jgi:hypothetical protein
MVLLLLVVLLLLLLVMLLASHMQRSMHQVSCKLLQHISW